MHPRLSHFETETDPKFLTSQVLGLQAGIYHHTWHLSMLLIAVN